MSFPPTHNLHNDAGSEDESRKHSLERCRTYVFNPKSTTLPDGLLPSDMIRPLLDNEPLSQQKIILANAVYHRVLAMEPEHSHSGQITDILMNLSNVQILYMLDIDSIFRTMLHEASTYYETCLRQRRDGMALTEEDVFAPATTPDRLQNNEEAPNQARTQAETQYQAQPTVWTQTFRNPRQNATAIENLAADPAGLNYFDAQSGTRMVGVTAPQPSPQTQFDWPMPQPQPIWPQLIRPKPIRPQQNEVASLTTAFSTLLHGEEEGKSEMKENQDLITNAGQDTRDG